MFRRPTEISSDSSSSSEDEGVNVSTDSAKAADEVEVIPTPPGQPLSAHDNDDGAGKISLAAPKPTDIMLAALLEELAHTRAAELLNNRIPGSTRNSPEVQHLAHQIFTTTSKAMAASGIITTDLAGDHLRVTRKAYIAQLDNIGRHSLNAAHVGAASTSSPRLNGQNQSLVVSRPEVVALPDWLPEADVRLAMNARAPFPSPLPFADLQILGPSSVNSRYRTDFQEIRCLGRGAFGQVYHVSLMMILEECC